MILRRFMQHVTEQNWFAVGLDVIVVVVGIFLGMQVNEWNANRHLHDLERQYLQALDIDIRASKKHLDNRLVRVGKQSEALEKILRSGSDGIEDLTDIEAASAIHYGLNTALSGLRAADGTTALVSAARLNAVGAIASSAAAPSASGISGG